MFKSAIILRIAPEFTLPDIAVLEEALMQQAFLPCSPTQPISSGWIAARGQKSTILAESVSGGVILKLQTETRAVPASAIADALEVKIQKYLDETGRERVSTKIKKELKEEVVLDLLPRAFTKRSSILLWVDPVNHFLVVDAASLGAADKAVSQLVEVLAECGSFCSTGIQARPLQTIMIPAAAMAHWLASREAPVNFSVDRECELKTPDDQKSSVRYARHTLEIDEIVGHINAGKVPTRLALTWNERASFVLSDKGSLSGITLLDVVLDGRDEAGKDDDGFDADAAIMTGELTTLIPDLIEALGGEVEVAGA
jgi:recombination associated protein RdgC